MNYFILLKIREQYQIDKKQLKENYYNLQILYHPDKAQTLKDKEKNLKLSSEINHAYNILKDDFQRAEYLLSLHNINLDGHKLNAEQLTIIWEEQEKFDNINSAEGFKLYYEEKLLEYSLLIEKLSSFFNTNQLERALDVLIELRYLNNLIVKCENKIKNGVD